MFGLIENWQPVELRCMIQDILGSEVYVKGDNPDNLGDRTIFYCITIPGENDWIRSCPKANRNDFFVNNDCSTSTKAINPQPETTNPATSDTTSTNESTNRQLNDENSNSNSNHNHHQLHHSQPHNTNTNSNGNTNSSVSEREKTMRLSSLLVTRSFPIPADGKNRSCLIKIYDMKLVENLRVNDILQVSGFLEPAEFDDDAQLLTSNKNHQNGNLSGGDHQNGSPLNIPSGFAQSFDDQFEPASDFPCRLVPRVHVQKIRKVKHINPLLPEIITRDKLDINTVRLAKAKLSTFINQLLGGDLLATEYLIMSLIARIHRRDMPTTLGQMSINLSGFKPEMKFLIDKLYDFISKITTHSHHIDMSIAVLNNLRFTPSKDHTNNKMIAGTLQLPDGLCLLLNETALLEGILTVQGTSNIEALSNIIRWQRLTYDFKFHSVQIDTDIKIIVISEGKSCLPVALQIPLANNDPDTIASMKQACDRVDEFLTEEILNMFRYYITALIEVPEYSIPDDITKLVGDHYAEFRRQAESRNEALMTAEDLSQLMTIARYVAISRGETILTKEIFEETWRMDLERRARLSTTAQSH